MITITLPTALGWTLVFLTFGYFLGLVSFVTAFSMYDRVSIAWTKIADAIRKSER